MKGEILNLISNDKIKDKELCREVLGFLISDANYGIRKKVEEINKEKMKL